MVTLRHNGLQDISITTERSLYSLVEVNGEHINERTANTKRKACVDISGFWTPGQLVFFGFLTYTLRGIGVQKLKVFSTKWEREETAL